MLLKVTTAKNKWFVTIGFLIMLCELEGCNDLTMLWVNISDIAIITVKDVGYCCIINNISKSEVINLLKKNCAWWS